MQPIVTSEFQRDFEAQTARALRPGFMWFLGVIGGMYLLSFGVMAAVFGLAASGALPGGSVTAQKLLEDVRFGEFGLVIAGVLVALDLAVYAWCWVRVLRRPMGRAEMVRFTLAYFLFRGGMDLVTGYLFSTPGFPWYIMLTHVLACVFLPWGPLQALRPMAILLAVNALVIVLLRPGEATSKAVVMVLSLLTPLPGMGIAWFKQSRTMERLRVQMLQARYGQMRRELVDARRIHEALFPEPIEDGPLRLTYRYEPMRQIGGDYLYARFAPRVEGPTGTPTTGVFNVLLLDVTGHGIAAALTVNRLYGEVERVFAEDPHVGPGEVLAALNRYVHLTLANHSIYATALCVRVDHERNELSYASGGHPPALLCTADGRIQELGSTAMVLGAVSAAEFDPCVQSVRFEEGDTLLAYTDGAIETRGDMGRMLGVNGLLKVVSRGLAACRAARADRAGTGAAGTGGKREGNRDGSRNGVLNAAANGADASAECLAEYVIRAVDEFRLGPAEDDTLVVEVRRAVGSGAAAGGGNGARVERGEVRVVTRG